MAVASVPELDGFAWTHPLLPRHISVALCPAEAADDLDLVRFAPADAT